MPQSNIRIDTNLLYLPFRLKVLALLAGLDAASRHFFVTSGYRGEYEQNELYAKGRTTPGPKVTNARFGYSTHNFGLGIDVTHDSDIAKAGLQPDWKESNYEGLGIVAKKHGLIWGGHWQSLKDLPHFEFDLKALGLTLSDLRTIYSKDKLPGVWKLIDAASKG